MLIDLNAVTLLLSLLEPIYVVHSALTYHV